MKGGGGGSFEPRLRLGNHFEGESSPPMTPVCFQRNLVTFAKARPNEELPRQ